MGIAQKIRTVLKKHDHDCTDEAIKRITETWYSRKKTLRKLLSRHPAWNKCSQKITISVVNTEEVVANRQDAAIRFFPLFPQSDCRWIIANAIQNGMTTLDKDTSDALKAAGMKHAPVGKKLSKIINAWAEAEGKPENYDAVFAPLSDAINAKPREFEIHASIHPVDFLLMGVTAHYESCHSIDGEHLHQAGASGVSKGSP